MRSRQNVMSVEARVSNLETKFEAFMRAHEDFKTEMRDRDNQRAAEIRELRQKHDADMKDMNQRFYAKFDVMDAKFDRLGDKIQNMVIAAVVGFGAIAAAVGGIVYAALK
ncbi:MAG: hypothetical protein IJ685_08830 [Selenomonadaceae bacterium]|nr:hypothetical protein [Selenomonadaceae bacterium]